MKIEKIYYFLIILLIAISGNSAVFGVFGKEAVYIVSLMIFISLWFRDPLKLRRQDKFILVLFSLMMVGHLFVFGPIVIKASLGFFITLSIAMLAVRLIPNFSSRYVVVMYVLSLLSLAFWVPMIFGVDMKSVFSALRIPLSSGDYHIGIANLRSEYDGSIRNMGMFWEPGAFAGYLVLALFFILRDAKQATHPLKRVLVIVVALLSTQSTTGYLAFMVLIIFYVYSVSMVKNRSARFLILPFFAITLSSIIYMSFNELPILGAKIFSQIESTSNRTDASRINRFGNFLYDLNWIKDRPIVGWGATPATRFTYDSEVLDLVAGQGNGLTGFAVKFGLFGLAVFIGYFGYVTRQITGSLSITMLGLFVVCLLLNGEQFLNFPIFLSLMFMPKKDLRPPAVAPISNVRKHGLTVIGTGRYP